MPLSPSEKNVGCAQPDIREIFCSLLPPLVCRRINAFRYQTPRQIPCDKIPNPATYCGPYVQTGRPKKTRLNPPDQEVRLDKGNSRAAPRRRARCRESKFPCRAPAMHGRPVGRPHGGKGDCPKRDKNGAQGPGYNSAEAAAGRPGEVVDPGYPTEGLLSNARVGYRATTPHGLGGKAHDIVAPWSIPRSARNGAYRTGRYIAEAKVERREQRALLRQLKELIGAGD